ncbi:MAG TPA: hypothetical protein VFU72_03110 [Nitrolancea sp.]|nr:hypothetical protein [Nitrolancea sp.]
MALRSDVHAASLLRRGLRLEYATLGWNVVGVVAGLAGFGPAR